MKENVHCILNFIDECIADLESSSEEQRGRR